MDVSNPETAVVSLHDGSLPRTSAVVVPRWAAFCAARKYRWLPASKGLFGVPQTYTKPVLIAEALALAEWVAWVDTDTVPRTRNRSFAEWTALYPDADLIIGSDHNGINAGVFLVRRSPAALEMLKRVWMSPRAVKWEDQGQLRAVIDAMSDLRTVVLHRPDFNAMNNDGRWLAVDPWIYHAAGHHGDAAKAALLQSTFSN